MLFQTAKVVTRFQISPKFSMQTYIATCSLGWTMNHTMQKGVDQCRINGWAIFKVMLQNKMGVSVSFRQHIKLPGGQVTRTDWSATYWCMIVPGCLKRLCCAATSCCGGGQRCLQGGRQSVWGLCANLSTSGAHLGGSIPVCLSEDWSRACCAGMVSRWGCHAAERPAGAAPWWLQWPGCCLPLCSDGCAYLDCMHAACRRASSS